MFEQHAFDCDGSDDCAMQSCTMIVGIQDGTPVWRSHMDAAVPPELRVNVDYPEVLDHRDGHAGESRLWRLPTDDEREAWSAAGFPLEDHSLRALAFRVAANPDHPANLDELAEQLGTTSADIETEARERGRDLPDWATRHEALSASLAEVQAEAAEREEATARALEEARLAAEADPAPSPTERLAQLGLTADLLAFLRGEVA